MLPWARFALPTLLVSLCVADTVIPALVAGIRVFKAYEAKTWMAGTSPAMTDKWRRESRRIP
jgi:hypothetical protein